MRVGTKIGQRTDARLVAFRSGHEAWCESVVARLIRIGSKLGQRTDARLVAFRGGDNAWRRSVFVRLIRIAAELDQRTDARLVAIQSGNIAWCCAITFGCMRIAARCEELLRNVPHHVGSPGSDCSEQQPRIIGIGIFRITVGVSPGVTQRRVPLVEINRPGRALVKSTESID